MNAIGVGASLGLSHRRARRGFPSAASILFFSQDVTGAGIVIRNRAEKAPVQSNLLGSARLSENPYRSVVVNNVTRTGDAAGRDGAMKAVRYVYSNGGSSPLAILIAKRLPAGTYTWQFDAISDGGSDAGIRMRAGSAVVSRMAGTGWSTLSQTFTLASETTLNFEILGGTATTFDIRVDNISCVPGSAAAEIVPLNRHLQATQKPNMSGSVIEGSSSLKAMMRARLQSAEVQQSELSIVAAVRMDPAIPEMAGTIFSIINEVESAAELNGGSGFRFGAISSRYGLSGIGDSGLATADAGPSKAGWCVLTVTAGAAGTDLWLNRLKVGSKAAAYVGGTFGAVEIMAFRDNLSYAFPGKVAFLGMWNRKLGEAEVANAYAAAVRQIAACGEAFTDFGSALVAEGDSITTAGYVANAGRLFAPRLQAINYSVAGSGINAGSSGSLNLNEAARKAKVKAKIAEIAALGKRPLLSVLIGTNDASGPIQASPANYFAIVDSYWQEMRAAGALVIGQTMTAYASSAQHAGGLTAAQQAKVDAYNQLIRDGRAAGKCDALADHAAGEMGSWSSANFYDQVHPTAAGHGIMASTLQAALNPLVV